ncbi:MAG: hypothetical protein A2X86_21000 [Bdellovibrionales bacterium GWA2_49_15]|nr:MAG: hypothetical protein A2X86_21000 [Bdellovibrionales bacterium GWA2_49_15]HAZ14857.1 hypothetical protein [Bdellovibrionales bacterium]
MKKQLLVSAMGLALTVSALAQGTTGQTSVSTSSIGNTWNALKESPLSLSIAIESDTTRNEETKKIDGVTQVNAAYLGYKFSPNDSMTLENDYNFVKQQNTDASYSYDRINLGYSRKNILTEADHGVAMKATVDVRYRPQGSVRVATNSYGQARVSANFSKNIGPVSLSMTNYYARPQRINTADTKTTSTWEHYLVQTYNITDTLGLSLAQDIVMRNNPGNEGELKTADLYLDLGKSLTPDFSIGAFVSGSPVASKDRWVTTPDWEKSENLTYAAYLSLTVF